VGKLEDKRQLRRNRRRWKVNVKWIFKEYDGGGRGLYSSGSGKGQAAGICDGLD
jgi:hypothetical protein